MKKIKLPSSKTLLIGSLGAFWLADKVNPGFNSVGILLLLLIPVLLFELLYPDSELDKILVPGEPTPAVDSTIEATTPVKKGAAGESIN